MSKLDDLHRRLEAAKNSGIEERAHTALGRLRAEMAETNAYIAALEAENERLEAENERLQTESAQKSAWISHMLGEQARDATENARLPRG